MLEKTFIPQHPMTSKSGSKSTAYTTGAKENTSSVAGIKRARAPDKTLNTLEGSIEVIKIDLPYKSRGTKKNHFHAHKALTDLHI